MVKKVLPNGVLYLTDAEAKIEEMVINANAIKIFMYDLYVPLLLFNFLCFLLVF